MPLISMRQLLDHAAERGYGVPAFNVNNMEQIKAIMGAAQKTKSPVILQGSAGARKYAGEPFLRHLVAAAVEAYPDLPIVMHQDHGASPDVCMGAIRSGFTSVMMDGSLKDDAKTPADYAYNVAVTHKVVGFAHAIGVSVEAELGCLGSLEMLGGDKEDGHGVDRIKAIHRRLPNTHLVMHGSSSVPQRLLEEIRCYGGDIRETYGVPVAEIREGIRHGVRKVNIDTDIRLAMTAAMRRTMKENSHEFDPRKFLQAAMDETQKVCVERFEAFGSAGQAPDIDPIELEIMAQRYKAGTLRQVVH